MKISLLKVGFICLLLSGCMNAKHLVYVHGATLGLDVAASTQAGTGRLVFGYDRDTFAIIPRKNDNEDAMSLAAVSCIYAKGLNDVQFRHFVSTGKTAINIAQDSETLGEITDIIQGSGVNCSKSGGNNAINTGTAKEEIKNTTQGGK